MGLLIDKRCEITEKEIDVDIDTYVDHSYMCDL